MITKMYALDKTKPLESKLAVVKAVKNLTGLGLKEAKEQCDILFDMHTSYNKYRKDYIELDIIDNNQEVIDDLREVNIMVEGLATIRDRELHELLMKFSARIIGADETYSVTEGDYKIENGITTITVIEGKHRKSDNIFERDITDVKVVLDSRVVIIEDQLD